METFYEVMRRQGISRRSLLKFCSLTATSLGLGPAFVPQIAHAMENKPRTPVLWLHGLECTCCSESFIRSAHPLAKDVVLSMISLDYDDLLMAAAGHQAEAALDEVIEKYKGQYILAVEGNGQSELWLYVSLRVPQLIARFLPYSVLLATITRPGLSSRILASEFSRQRSQFGLTLTWAAVQSA